MLLRLCWLLSVCCVHAVLGQSGTAMHATDIVTGIRSGYQLLVIDLNHDGHKDFIVVDERGTELAWYEGPSWSRHVLAANLPRVINLDGADLNGDGIPELAVAQHFEQNPERSLGTLLLLKSGPDPRQPWTSLPFDHIPTAHRIRWIRLAKTGLPTLLVAPLVGLKSRAPDYADTAPIYAYQPTGAAQPDKWTRTTISNDLKGVLHSIAPVRWGNDERQQLLTASFDGLTRLEPTPTGVWKRHNLAAGDTRPCPLCGSSEVKMGHLGRRRFIASIEPWHGNQVVVYSEQGKQWKRTVLDDAMLNGHALAVGDLDGDGRDEIVAGFRGTGYRVTVFRAQDAAGERWKPEVIDEGHVAGADCQIADLTGDGRADIACSGAATGNVRLFTHAAASSTPLPR